MPFFSSMKKALCGCSCCGKDDDPADIATRAVGTADGQHNQHPTALQQLANKKPEANAGNAAKAAVANTAVNAAQQAAQATGRPAVATAVGATGAAATAAAAGPNLNGNIVPRSVGTAAVGGTAAAAATAANQAANAVAGMNMAGNLATPSGLMNNKAHQVIAGAGGAGNVNPALNSPNAADRARGRGGLTSPTAAAAANTIPDQIAGGTGGVNDFRLNSPHAQAAAAGGVPAHVLHVMPGVTAQEGEIVTLNFDDMAAANEEIAKAVAASTVTHLTSPKGTGTTKDTNTNNAAAGRREGSPQGRRVVSPTRGPVSPTRDGECPTRCGAAVVGGPPVARLQSPHTGQELSRSPIDRRRLSPLKRPREVDEGTAAGASAAETTANTSVRLQAKVDAEAQAALRGITTNMKVTKGRQSPHGVKATSPVKKRLHDEEEEEEEVVEYSDAEAEEPRRTTVTRLKAAEHATDVTAGHGHHKAETDKDTGLNIKRRLHTLHRPHGAAQKGSDGDEDEGGVFNISDDSDSSKSETARPVASVAQTKKAAEATKEHTIMNKTKKSTSPRRGSATRSPPPPPAPEFSPASADEADTHKGPHHPHDSPARAVSAQNSPARRRRSNSPAAVEEVKKTSKAHKDEEEVGGKSPRPSRPHEAHRGSTSPRPTTAVAASSSPPARTPHEGSTAQVEELSPYPYRGPALRHSVNAHHHTLQQHQEEAEKTRHRDPHAMQHGTASGAGDVVVATHVAVPVVEEIDDGRIVRRAPLPPPSRLSTARNRSPSTSDTEEAVGEERRGAIHADEGSNNSEDHRAAHDTTTASTTTSAHEDEKEEVVIHKDGTRTNIVRTVTEKKLPHQHHEHGAHIHPSRHGSSPEPQGDAKKKIKDKEGELYKAHSVQPTPAIASHNSKDEESDEADDEKDELDISRDTTTHNKQQPQGSTSEAEAVREERTVRTRTTADDVPIARTEEVSVTVVKSGTHHRHCKSHRHRTHSSHRRGSATATTNDETRSTHTNRDSSAEVARSATPPSPSPAPHFTAKKDSDDDFHNETKKAAAIAGQPETHKAITATSPVKPAMSLVPRTETAKARQAMPNTTANTALTSATASEKDGEGGSSTPTATRLRHRLTSAATTGNMMHDTAEPDETLVRPTTTTTDMKAQYASLSITTDDEAEEDEEEAEGGADQEGHADDVRKKSGTNSETLPPSREGPVLRRPSPQRVYSFSEDERESAEAKEDTHKKPAAQPTSPHGPAQSSKPAEKANNSPRRVGKDVLDDLFGQHASPTTAAAAAPAPPLLPTMPPPPPHNVNSPATPTPGNKEVKKSEGMKDTVDKKDMGTSGPASLPGRQGDAVTAKQTGKVETNKAEKPPAWVNEAKPPNETAPRPLPPPPPPLPSPASTSQPSRTVSEPRRSVSPLANDATTPLPRPPSPAATAGNGLSTSDPTRGAYPTLRRPPPPPPLPSPVEPRRAGTTETPSREPASRPSLSSPTHNNNKSGTPTLTTNVIIPTPPPNDMPLVRPTSPTRNVLVPSPPAGPLAPLAGVHGSNSNNPHLDSSGSSLSNEPRSGMASPTSPRAATQSPPPVVLLPAPKNNNKSK